MKTIAPVYLIRLTQNEKVSYFGVQRGNVSPNVVCFTQKDLAYKMKTNLMSHKRVYNKYPKNDFSLENIWEKWNKNSILYENVELSVDSNENDCEVFKVDYNMIEFMLNMNNIPISICMNVGMFLMMDDIEMKEFPQSTVVDMLNCRLSEK